MSEHLRVLCVAAPQWPRRAPGVEIRSLHADDPFSLQNAMRHAAGQAERPESVWSSSNWSSLEGRRESMLLHEFCDDQIHEYEGLLRQLQPNIVFIGSMSLSFPGAIRYAAMAKLLANDPDDVLVVLGGKHSNETMLAIGDKIHLLDCSPIKLMERGPRHGGIDGVFDIVVSGEGEEVVTALGELVIAALSKGKRATYVRESLDMLPEKAGGEWIVATSNCGGSTAIVTSNRPLDFSNIPTAPSMFGIQGRFSVFGTDFTGHAYSDMGRGCVMNCFFCSEQRSVNGKHVRSKNAPYRLLKHFQDIVISGRSQKAVGGVSAFVEDSIFLGANKELMNEFAFLLENNPECQIPFGMQLTVDCVRQRWALDVMKRLKDVGLSYVAMGIETLSEELAVKMDKHIQPGPVWSHKTEAAIKRLVEDLGMDVGVYVLWGWGESQSFRESMMATLYEWQQEHNQPCWVGLNWLTIHPLGNRGNVLDPSAFIDWGTPADSEYLAPFIKLFGEASVNYCFPEGDFNKRNKLGVQAPSPEELERLVFLYHTMNKNA